MAATKKYKAPAGMNPEDAKDWEKHGSFVHHFEGGGPLYDLNGNPIKPYSEPAKKTAKKKKTTKKKAK